MSKKANTTVIGAFVVSALALIAAGLLVYGGGRFFAKANNYVLFFHGSAKGLNVGAPVAFKGVKMGTVTDVKLLYDRRDQSFKIMVVISIEPQKVTEIGSDHGLEKLPAQPQERELIDTLIAQGLRAQLGMQSLLTGLLYVDMDFYPDKPARLVGLNVGYRELPTIPSSLEQLTKTVQSLPLEDIVAKVSSAVEGIERFVNSPHAQELSASLDAAIKEAHALLRNVNERIEPLADNVDKTLADARKLLSDVDSHVNPLAGEIKATVREARGLVSHVDQRVGPLSSSLEDTFKSAQAAMKQAESALTSLADMTGEQSSFRYELSNVLKELSSASRAIRSLADYMERHPESLLQGKSKQGGK